VPLRFHSCSMAWLPPRASRKGGRKFMVGAAAGWHRRLEAFVGAVAALFENREAGLVGVADGDRLGHLGGAEGADLLLDRLAAERAVGEGGPAHWPTQIKTPPAGGASLFGIFGDVGIGGHERAFSPFAACRDAWTPGQAGSYQLDLVTPG